MEKEVLYVGLDVGSTTVKIIVMDKNKNTIYYIYGSDLFILILLIPLFLLLFLVLRLLELHTLEF